MSTREQIAELDDQALFREWRAIKEQELAVRNAKMWALDELVRRGLAAKCKVCDMPIDPEHGRHYDVAGGQRHVTCKRGDVG